MKGNFPIERFSGIETPFYYYDSELLRKTLNTINDEAGTHENFSACIMPLRPMPTREF